MTKREIIFLRGPSAVGKTAIAKSLLLSLKGNFHKNCAYISEDNFRKKMQFKYKAEDRKAHINSAHLITSVIKELVKTDSYDSIIIEGLFRYKEIVQHYNTFCKKNKFDPYWFQLKAPLSVRKERNRLNNVRDHISHLQTPHGRGKEEEKTLKDSIVLDTRKPISHSINLILSAISSKKIKEL